MSDTLDNIDSRAWVAMFGHPDVWVETVDKVVVCEFPGDAESFERRKARAKLIAATRELLDALEYLLELGGDDDRRIAAEVAIEMARGERNAAHQPACPTCGARQPSWR